MRLPRGRTTTHHAASLFPFSIQGSLGPRGVLIGQAVLAGGTPFHFDPFTAYEDGRITNPNLFISGAPGYRKSTLVKTFLWRMAAIYGDRRYIAALDPKGEYSPLADALGMPVLRLQPGGSCCLNPLDGAGPGVDAARYQALTEALIQSVLRTAENDALTMGERTALRAAVTVACDRPGATLREVIGLLREPAGLVASAGHTDLDRLKANCERPAQAGNELLTGPLAGMFDGPSTVKLDFSQQGVVIDLSAVYDDRAALPLVMLAATGWLTELRTLSSVQKQWVQVLDECWALLSDGLSAEYLQACWKLGRTQGVSNWLITHRVSDLRSQSDDGTKTAKIALGLLADTATRITLHQEAGEIAETAAALGLNAYECEVVRHLIAGRALWQIGAVREVVQHIRCRQEVRITDTDANMRAA